MVASILPLHNHQLSLLPETPEGPALFTATLTLGGLGSLQSFELDDLWFDFRSLTFTLDKEVEEGAHAWLEFSLPSGETLRPLVRIQGRGKKKLNARFVHLYPKARKALENYLETRSRY